MQRASVQTCFVPADGKEPASIRLLIENAAILEHKDTGALAPAANLNRRQALALAYRLGELANKLRED